MEKVTKDESLMAAGSYLFGFITAIIFFFVGKDSKFVRFHAIQSIVFSGFISILSLAISFISLFGILSGYLSMQTLFNLDFLVSSVLSSFFKVGLLMGIIIVLNVIDFIIRIILIIKSFQGQMYKLPLIGNFSEQLLKKFNNNS